MMRNPKRLAVIVLAVILLWCGIAAADETKDGAAAFVSKPNTQAKNAPEITFRLLQWGIDAVTFRDEMLMDVGNEAIAFNQTLLDNMIYSWKGAEYFDPTTGKMRYIEEEQYSPTYYYIDIPVDGELVASYPVSMVSGFAIPAVVDGVISDDPHMSRLVTAQYIFNHAKINDLNAAALDLQNKLSEVLGDPVRWDYEFSTTVMWYGGNQTYAALNLGKDESGNINTIYAYYGRSDINDLIDELSLYVTADNPRSTAGLIG